jgi:hypothetical protein
VTQLAFLYLVREASRNPYGFSGKASRTLVELIGEERPRILFF